MPHADNLAKLLLVIHSVDDAVWTKNYLANILVLIFGNHATELRVCLEMVRFGDQFIAERHRDVSVTTGGEDPMS